MSSDPTRIDIRFDPTVQRMRGVARHGNTSFDVPYISHIYGNLYQGGCADGLILPPHIKNVISLYKWESYKITHDLDSFMEVTMYDSSDPDEMFDTEQLLALASWVNVCSQRGPTLVHCQAGLNRSSLVAALSLMLTKYTANEAIYILRKVRSAACLCNPLFEEFLLGLDIQQPL